MAKDGFAIKELSEELAQILAAQSTEGFTGSVSMIVHFRSGGIGKVDIQTNRTIHRKGKGASMNGSKY